jgi:hypothetical protein
MAWVARGLFSPSLVTRMGKRDVSSKGTDSSIEGNACVTDMSHHDGQRAAYILLVCQR